MSGAFHGKALIFAAGLGERMRPLTERTPKPLLVVGGKPLIVWHIERLAAAGVRTIVINTSWLAEQFPQTLGDGRDWNVRLVYSYEGATPLETGGGMLHALPHLQTDANPEQPFIAVNGDVWCDADFSALPNDPRGDAHLVLVENPLQHPQGDFVLAPDGGVQPDGDAKLTFSGIGIYRPSILSHWRSSIGSADGAHDTPPRFKLAPVLRAAMARGGVTGAYHAGRWTDIGTPERLAQLRTTLT